MAEPIITPKLFTFLRQLKQNNHRDWFTDNKVRYQQEVLLPAVELVRQLEKPLAKIAPMLSVIPQAHNGSVMRIYRDTRFGKDKTPYKTNVGISVRHQANKDIHAPGVYIHLEPAECFVGAGCWRPESNVLAAIRVAIDADPKAWKRARDNAGFRKYYQLAGESLKSSPRDYAKDHPLIEDLKRIDFIAISPLQPADFCADDIVKQLLDRIQKAKPFMQFLCDAIDVPY
jgi:uncharacterized protein (TIGR02453 family)